MARWMNSEEFLRLHVFLRKPESEAPCEEGGCLEISGLNFFHERGEECAKALSQSLQASPGVNQLEIRGCNFPPACLREIGGALHSLESLSMEDIHVDPEAIQNFVSALSENLPIKLRELKISEMQFGPDGTQLLCNWFLNQKMPLTHLTLDRLSMENLGLAFVMESLQSMTKLEALCLTNNGITRVPRVKLDRVTALRELRLGGNPLGPTEVDVFLNTICKPNSLEVVDLGAVNLGDNGVGAIVGHIPAMPRLKTLVLNNNSITQEGANILFPYADKFSSNLKNNNLPHDVVENFRGKGDSPVQPPPRAQPQPQPVPFISIDDEDAFPMIGEQQEEMARQIEGLRKELEQAREAANAQAERAGQVESQAAEQEGHVAHLKDQLAKSESSLTELTEKFSNSEEMRKELGRNFDGCNEARRKSENEAAQLAEQLAKSEEDRKELVRKADECNAERRKAEEEAELAFCRIKEMQQTIKESTAAIEEAQATCKKAAMLEKEKDNLEVQNRELAAKVEKLEQEKNMAEEEKGALEEEVAVQKSRVQDLTLHQQRVDRSNAEELARRDDMIRKAEERAEGLIQGLQGAANEGSPSRSLGAPAELDTPRKGQKRQREEEGPAGEDQPEEEEEEEEQPIEEPEEPQAKRRGFFGRLWLSSPSKPQPAEEEGEDYGDDEQPPFPAL